MFTEGILDALRALAVDEAGGRTEDAKHTLAEFVESGAAARAVAEVLGKVTVLEAELRRAAEVRLTPAAWMRLLGWYLVNADEVEPAYRAAHDRQRMEQALALQARAGGALGRLVASPDAPSIVDEVRRAREAVVKAPVAKGRVSSIHSARAEMGLPALPRQEPAHAPPPPPPRPPEATEDVEDSQIAGEAPEGDLESGEVDRLFEGVMAEVDAGEAKSRPKRSKLRRKRLGGDSVNGTDEVTP